jgi:hypothetical protein
MPPSPDDADEVMTEDEARAELRHRYRVRFLLEVEHEGKSYGARGSTMAVTPEETEAAATGLLRVMIGRALAQLEEPEAERH